MDIFGIYRIFSRYVPPLPPHCSLLCRLPPTLLLCSACGIFLLQEEEEDKVQACSYYLACYSGAVFDSMFSVKIPHTGDTNPLDVCG